MGLFTGIGQGLQKLFHSAWVGVYFPDDSRAFVCDASDTKAKPISLPQISSVPTLKS